MVIIKRGARTPLDFDLLDARDLQKAFYTRFKTSYEILVFNTYIKGWAECDLLGIKPSGYVEEIEIKLSRPDFKADFKKNIIIDGVEYKKHDLLASKSASPVNYYWFMAPEGLLAEHEIPSYAGLIELTQWGRASIRKNAPLLHRTKANTEFKYMCVRQQCWRVWQNIFDPVYKE